MTQFEDADAFGGEITASLASALENDLIGTYFVGSIALGGYIRGESDIDIAAVCRRPLPIEMKKSLADAISRTTVSCPTRGLEFSLYRAEVASSLPEDAGFEINVNGGPRMKRKVRLSTDDEPAFWYLLDRAIAHRYGVTIFGPPAAEVFMDVPRPQLLEAMGNSVRWHREHEKTTLYSVLNACRAWRFAVENGLVSKLDGAAWARERWPRPSLIDAAVDLRHGRCAHLDAAAVEEFLDHVQRVLAGATLV